MVAGGGASNPYSGVDAMAILLPLSLIGLGACIYYLFVGATLALPILIGSAVGMASHAAGNAVPASFFPGMGALMWAVAPGRFGAQTLQLGSASGRERVGRTGWTWGGARDLNKKKQKTANN